MSHLGKQLAYGVFYLVFFGAIVFLIYFLFFRQAPSCFDGIRSQNETGVDCGGVCAKFCLPADLKPIEIVGDVSVFRPSADQLSFLAKIQNPNSEAGAKSFGYRFDLYDENNRMVKTVSGESFVYASEIKYLAEFADVKSLPKIDHVELSLTNLEWVNSDDFARPKIILQDKKIESSGGDVKISGRLLNDDTLDFPATMVVVVLKGAYGQLLGVSETRLDNLMAGEARSFTVLHPAVPGLDPGKTGISIFARRP